MTDSRNTEKLHLATTLIIAGIVVSIINLGLSLSEAIDETTNLALTNTSLGLTLAGIIVGLVKRK
jgi:hypothetical protein